MTELAQIFAELSISQYLETFIEQGFDTWETILDITESDFDVLGVKLGHRRKIQRRIADFRGLSTERALASPTQHGSALDDRQPDEDQKASRTKGEGKDNLALNNGGKRKYRRHPKPDDKAPERPPSAYVIFSNKIREDLKQQRLSFTEIAKLVGEKWQTVTPSEKEPYESQAFAAKEKYNNELTEYKKTENYRNYQAYLAEFKAKHSSSQQAISDAESSKRPKLENRISNDSSGNGSSSATSQAGDTPVTRKRVYSGASNTSMPWYSQNPVTTQPVSSSSNTAAPKSFSGPTNMKSRTSPVANKSPHILPGYRDSLSASLPIRDASRDAEASSFQQPQSLPQLSKPHSSLANIQMSRNRPNEQHIFGTMPGHPPPMLTHDSTVESASSGSSSVGPVFTPRTPMDVDQRTSQFPNIFPTKLPGFFESHQLPPLRPPSLSPQSSVNTGYHSPQGIALTMEYAGQTQAQHSLRNYQHIPSQQAMHISKATDASASAQPHGASTYVDDGEIEHPFSALLKAGEIVDRNAQNRQSQNHSE